CDHDLVGGFLLEGFEFLDERGLGDRIDKPGTVGDAPGQRRQILPEGCEWQEKREKKRGDEAGPTLLLAGKVARRVGWERRRKRSIANGHHPDAVCRPFPQGGRLGMDTAPFTARQSCLRKGTCLSRRSSTL